MCLCGAFMMYARRTINVISKIDRVRRNYSVNLLAVALSQNVSKVLITWLAETSELTLSPMYFYNSCYRCLIYFLAMNEGNFVVQLFIIIIEIAI